MVKLNLPVEKKVEWVLSWEGVKRTDIPFVARFVSNVQAVQLSSMGLLIMVGVILDTMKQMEAQLTMRRYEGFIK